MTLDAQAQTILHGRVTVLPGFAGMRQNGVIAGPLVDLSAGLRTTYLLDNGVGIGVEGILRVQRDTRNGFARTIAACPPEHDLCPHLMGAHGQRIAPVSPTTGLTTAPISGPPAARIGFDTAVVSLSGGWGEIILGRDFGAAVRLDARAPAILAASGAARGAVDPLGANIARARNDPSGVAFKATFFSPRLFGLRAGLSVTPGEAAPAVDGPAYSDISVRLHGLVETALSFQHRFANGTLLRSAATFATGSSSRLANYGAYRALGLGVEVERDSWHIGARWLISNNAQGFAQDAYQAVELGITRKVGQWRWGVEMSAARDDLLAVRGYHLTASVARDMFKDNVRLALALAHGRTDVPHAGATGRARLSGNGVLAEITIMIAHRS